MKRRIIISLFGSVILFLWMDLKGSSVIVQGEVSGTWSVDSVLVIGDVLVPKNLQLVIQPGVKIIFQGSYSISIEGSLLAQGTALNPILFTVSDTTGFSDDTVPDGGWKGVRFLNPFAFNDSSLFVHCCFNFGKAVSEVQPEGNGGAVCIVGFDRVRIEGCHFERNFASYNGGAIFLDSADVVIRDCFFHANACGQPLDPWGYGGAICSDHSSPRVWGSHFEENRSTGTGGGIAMRFRDGTISNNEFTHNYSALGGAVAVLHMDAITRTNCNNLIYGNMAEYFGGGIANIDASPTWVNNTLADNSAMYGGGFYCKDSVTPSLFNCILWGNVAFSGYGNQVYLFEPYSQANFYYCDVQLGPDDFGGSGGVGGFYGVYENNMDLYPSFDLNGYLPYSLSGGSPCIDAGTPDTIGLQIPATDLSGSPRIWNDRIDIGSYEMLPFGSRHLHREEHKTRLYPNPACDYFYLDQSEDPARIEIYDMQGRQFCCVEGPLVNLPVDVGKLKDGCYQVVITMPTGAVGSALLMIRRVK